MRVFFTKRGELVEDRDEIDAIDIVTHKFTVRIRISGILAMSNETKEVVLDQNLDLTPERTVGKRA